MKKLIITSTFLFLSAIGIAQNLNTQKLDSLFNLLEQNDKFMGSLAVSHNGKTIYKNTIGFANLEDSAIANENTIYRIGSVSKIFTAALILQAIEDNKLHLEQKLQDFFPQVANSETITIKNLLSHSSGIHDFTREENYSNWSDIKQSKDSMVLRIANFKSDFNPGIKSEYSNSNFVLLTFILEDIYTKSYESLLKDKITAPLQLDHTFYGAKINPTNNEAYSYYYLGKWIKKSETEMSVPQGAGAIVSTPKDLNTFITALFNGKIISNKSLDLMKNIENGYGLGLLKFPYNDTWSYGHTGSIDAFETVTSYFPEDKLAISLSTNGRNYDKNDILLAVLGSYYGEEVDLPKFNMVKLTSKDLDKYLGTYATEEMPLKITMTKEGNVLISQATGQSAFPLEADGVDHFNYDRAGIKIKFNPANNTFLLMQGGRELEFKME